MNLRFIEPQKRYFQEMHSFNPNLVCFIEAVTIEDNVKRILETMPSTAKDHTYSIELLEFMVSWLRRNKASDFY